MYTFHRHGDLSPLFVGRLKYKPNSFILVVRGLILLAIVPTMTLVFESLPSSTLIDGGTMVGSVLRLLTKNMSETFADIFLACNRLFYCFCIDNTHVILKLK